VDSHYSRFDKIDLAADWRGVAALERTDREVAAGVHTAMPGHALLVYSALGSVFQSLGDLSKAIEYHTQHLAIAQKAGDQAGEGGAHGPISRRSSTKTRNSRLHRSLATGRAWRTGMAHGHGARWRRDYVSVARVHEMWRACAKARDEGAAAPVVPEAHGGWAPGRVRRARLYVLSQTAGAARRSTHLPPRTTSLLMRFHDLPLLANDKNSCPTGISDHALEGGARGGGMAKQRDLGGA
jgi:hypothetical protein